MNMSFKGEELYKGWLLVKKILKMNMSFKGEELYKGWLFAYVGSTYGNTKKNNKKCYPNTMIGVNHDTSRYVAKVSEP